MCVRGQYTGRAVGHAAPDECRREMVAWLKAKYPDTPVLALNPPDDREVAGADFNVELDAPEAWLSMVAGAVNQY